MAYGHAAQSPKLMKTNNFYSFSSEPKQLKVRLAGEIDVFVIQRLGMR